MDTQSTSWKVISIFIGSTFLDMDMTAQEIEKIITEDTHAAYPVIGDDPDEVMGIITVKDLIPRLWKKDFSLKQILQNNKIL